MLPYLLAVLRHIPVVEMPNEPAHEIKSFQTRFISKCVLSSLFLSLSLLLGFEIK